MTCRGLRVCQSVRLLEKLPLENLHGHTSNGNALHFLSPLSPRSSQPDGVAKTTLGLWLLPCSTGLLLKEGNTLFPLIV